MNLPKSQAELLAAMQAGATVHYSPYMGRFNPKAYWWIWESGRCTAAAEALLKKGLARKEGNYVKTTLVLTDEGRAISAPSQFNDKEKP